MDSVALLSFLNAPTGYGRYTISGRAVGGFVYNLKFNDTNVIAPADYVL